MRPVHLIAASVALATIGFVFGPDFAKLATEKETARTETRIAPAVLAPSLVTNAPSAMPKAPLAPKQLEKAEAAPKKTMALRRKARPEASAAASERVAYPASPFTDGAPRPEKVEHPANAQAAVSPAKLARREKNFSNPMESRWVKNLSGTDASLEMGKKNEAAPGCTVTTATPNCERKPAPRDLVIAGVVVKKEKVMKTPKQPVDGVLRQGSYLDYTPAVYVE